MSIDPTISINFLASLTEKFSGAEIVALCQEAALMALGKNSKMVNQIFLFLFPALNLNIFLCVKIVLEDIENCLNNFKPSFNNDLLSYYENFNKRLV
jgi:SpoVK/Ycf46/Vps4 family AAA+-type ATPase